MTDKLRAAAQALVDRWDSPQWGGSAENLRHTGEYIAALRDALAEQPAEPVAWQGVYDPTDLYWRKPPQTDVRPLYTAPQPAKRVPLTPPTPLNLTEHEASIYDRGWYECERAHGITGETE